MSNQLPFDIIVRICGGKDYMIAVWIVGCVFLSVGLFVCVPKYIKFIKCKGHTQGLIVNASMAHGTGSQPVRAFYEYYVDGTKYSKSTGWTNYAAFAVGKQCDVKYNLNNPNCSYIKGSGQIMNCVIGTIFAIVGIGVLCLGVCLTMIL